MTESPDVHESALVDVNILLVDDSPANLLSLRAILDLPGYRRVTASSGEEALRVLSRRSDFAVIVMDVMMPGMDGFETAQLIQRRKALAQIPIIFLTAHGAGELRDVDAYQAGAVDFLTKPVDPAILKTKIAVFVELYRKNCELKSWADKLEQRVIERTEALRAAEANYRIITENVGDLIAMLDRDGKRLYASPSFLTYFSAEQIAPGADSADLVHPDDRDRMAQLFQDTVQTGVGSRAEYRCIAKNGVIRYFESVGDAVHDAQGAVSHVIVVSRDITERRIAEERIRYLAHHDPLTGLCNRTYFAERIGQEIAHARRHNLRLAVMFVDLDRFKAVNDTLGHELGDALLRIVAERMRGCLREEDTIARLGGDEFSVLIVDAGEEQSLSLVAQKILDAVSAPVALEGHQAQVGASIGISVYPDDGATPELMLKNADLAMYRVKQSGRNQWRFFTPEMNLRVNQRLALESDLQDALELGQLVLYYQPVVDLRTGVPVALEAMLRWNHPVTGQLLPDSFITAAIDTGLVVPIGEWVLREVCRQHRAWQDSGTLASTLPIAINLHCSQLCHENFPATVEQYMAQFGIAPQSLEFEIGEAGLMADAKSSLDALAALARVGVRMTIDEFGIGYSSLVYLARFPLHRVKIARSLIGQIHAGDGEKAVIETLVNLARGLKLSVGGVGVENFSQLLALQQAGCDAAQGNHFSPPLPAAAIERLIRQQSSFNMSAPVTAATCG